MFDSSTGFKLANSAVRSPDVAWVSQKRWDALSEADRRGQQVFIYRENGSIDIRSGSVITLSGEGVLPELSVQIDF